MMLRDGTNELNPDLPEGMPEVWKRLSEKVTSVRNRICGRIDKALAYARREDERRAADNHSQRSDSSEAESTEEKERTGEIPEEWRRWRAVRRNRDEDRRDGIDDTEAR